MDDKRRSYESDALEVTWSASRCIHFRACVRGLPAVFDVDARPWIRPGEAEAEAVLEVVRRCPTGALHARRVDGSVADVPAAGAAGAEIRVAQDGPLYLHGRVRLLTEGGETALEDDRMALCRCGASAHKPFCDGSHDGAGFRDTGAFAPDDLRVGTGADGPLGVTPTRDGPLRLEGAVTLRDAGGLTTYRGGGGRLCRCGRSGHKPFCDGTHGRVGFEAPPLEVPPPRD